MLLELKIAYTCIGTSVSFTSVVKIAVICIMNTALEIEFPMNHPC